MLFMNEWDVERAERVYATYPNLGVATATLARLMRWTNRNSDGWPYWQKPVRSAKSLMTLIQSVDRWDPQDVTEAEVRKALSPVKAFLTRQGVDHALVMGEK